MSPRTRQSLAVAAVIVALAAIAGIAAIEGWLPEWFAGDTPVSVATPGMRIAGTVPPESLSPGEAIVTETAPHAKQVEPEPAMPARPAAEPRKPAPKTPTYAKPEPQKRSAQRGLCGNCGIVAATSYRQSDRRHDVSWEVRVKFDDGTFKVMRFPTDPGFRVGDRVFLADGRLHKD